MGEPIWLEKARDYGLLALACAMSLMVAMFSYMIGGLCVGAGECVSNGNTLTLPVRIYASLILLALASGATTWILGRPIRPKIPEVKSP